MRMRPQLNRFAGGFAAVTVVALWHVVSDLLGELLLPSPFGVLRAATRVGLAALYGYSMATLGRVMTGWALGCSAGLVMGFLMSRSRLFHESLRPVIEVMRPLPTVVLIPFFIQEGDEDD